MKDIKKYQGVIPAFYACYDAEGNISVEGVKALTGAIMLITAVVIKLYDKGPVLYKQVRCTKDAKEFYILKFRSMRVDAEKDGVARLAAPLPCLRASGPGAAPRRSLLHAVDHIFSPPGRHAGGWAGFSSA